MGLTVEEHKVVGPKQLVGDIDNAGLDVAGGVQDLAGKVACGGDNDEPAAMDGRLVPARQVKQSLYRESFALRRQLDSLVED